MKNKFIAILAILTAVLTFWGCNSGKSGSSAGEENFDKDASYALGMNIGQSLKDSLDMDGIVPNIDEFFKGFRDGMTGAETRFDMFEAMMIIEAAFSALTEEKNAEAIQNETSFLAENSKKPGIIITPSGLQYEIVTETGGARPSVSDTVLVHYEGRLIDGSIFDSSYDRGFPLDFPVSEIIAGWTEGLQLMGVGSKYILYVPSELGYGPNGVGPIPPYSTLIFTVELLDIL